MSVISVSNLRKSYKKGFIPKTHEVLKGVSFTIEPGTVTGFLGGNGAGKTTTMKCILGLAIPDSGEITYFDGAELDNATKSRIGFLPERPYFYEYLTGREFLQFYGEVSGRFKTRKDLKNRIDYLLKKVDLVHARDRNLKGYSKGMLQKIGLAQALIHSPEFVVLDEPMAGLDPDGRYYLSQLISETAAQGTSIFFSSHLLHDTERLCKNLVILKDGVVQYQGTTTDLISRVKPKSELKYIDSQGNLQIQECANSEELQAKIDEIRQAGKSVVTVSNHVESLEDAFIDFAMHETRDRL